MRRTISEQELIQRRERAYSLYLQMRPWIRRYRQQKLRDRRAIRFQQESVMEVVTEGCSFLHLQEKVS